MDQAQFLRKLGSASDDQERKIVIGDFWKDCAEHKSQAVFSDAFREHHLGTLSDSEMVKMAGARSRGATRDFISTILAESSAADLVTYIAKNIVPWMLKQELAFRNYLVDQSFQSRSMKVTAESGGGVGKGERIRPVVGIDQRGLVIHYHGPEEYARGDYWVVASDAGRTIWKKNR